MSDLPSSGARGTGRRLAAIVFTDIVGYSARMQRDENGTLALVQADFKRMGALGLEHGGEVLNTMGDGMLLCFDSAVQAVACALAMQDEFGRRHTQSPPDQCLLHRDRLRDILERLRPDEKRLHRHFAFHRVVNRLADAYAARRRFRLQPRGDVHAIARDSAAGLPEHIAEMHADPV